MFYSKLKIRNGFILFCIALFASCVPAIIAQSTSQSYPTPVVTNEISGTIKPRDIGDARLTNYFYTFNANQGDVFINVVTTDFNGDIDIFNADGLRHLTKIMVYADASVSETGRVIYFRKPEKLILRVEGRTPNDEAGTFKIKFAGSFVAAANVKSEEPPLPEVSASNQTDVRVNSVGTIIEVKPKSTPTPSAAAAKSDVSKDTIKEISIETNAEKSVIAETNVNDKNERKIEVKEFEQKLEVVKTDNTQTAIEKNARDTSETDTERAETRVANENKPVEKIAINDTVIAKTEETKTEETKTEEAKPKASTPKTRSKKSRTAKIVEPNPLENIHLIVLFKDGTKIERLMSEVLRVGVDKGVLTIISKNGTIGRYSILDVAKMTIE